jgi:prolyl-tRNA editing enzyme YbaK/EbsC (Cys-tRNA(Pro) deacylase)
MLDDSARTAAQAAAALGCRVGAIANSLVFTADGDPVPLPTLVDTALAAHDVVWAAAGHAHAVFATSYDELLRITAGRPAQVAG